MLLALAPLYEVPRLVGAYATAAGRAVVVAAAAGTEPRTAVVTGRP